MKRIFAIAAAVAALAACTKEQGYNASSFKEGQIVTLNVTADASATKVTSELNTTTGAVNFKWAAGDKVKVTVGTESAEFTLESGAGTNSATFTGTMPADGETFNVQYPVKEPTLTTQDYSSSEAIPHNMMKFAQTGCTTSSPTFSLTPQNAVLRLNLWGTSQTISKIVVTNMTSFKTYTLNISGGKELSDDSANPTPFFIVVPAGDWNFIAEIFDNAATPASICTFYKTSTDKYFAASTVLNMPAVEVAVPAPSPALTEDFTISAGPDGTQSTSDDVVVQFSKGNLQATCTAAGDETTATYSWGFAANQWDYIGKAAGNTTIDNQAVGAVVDLFGRVGASSTDLTSDNQKYGISTSEKDNDYGTVTEDALKADWAGIATLPQISGREWKTMSSSEWIYLLDTRIVNGGTGEGKSYQRATINNDVDEGVYGLIIYHDNYTSQKTLTKSYSSSRWATMVAAGCVFLPAAGGRNGSNVFTVDSFGYYWSSTPFTTDHAYYMYFSNTGKFSSSSSNYRYYGYSVRLVSIAE